MDKDNSTAMLRYKFSIPTPPSHYQGAVTGLLRRLKLTRVGHWRGRPSLHGHTRIGLCISLCLGSVSKNEVHGPYAFRFTDGQP